MQRRATKADATWAIRRLRAAGHEALLAGGCVRDMLMGHRPADYDVATGATPEQVRELFRRVRMVGAQFGVAMVVRAGRAIEVATFRTDASYSDGRHPDAVRFTSAREDARRRDFTINGMFYDPLERRVVDYVGGQRDLAAGVVRAIGDPGRRFAEDHLRMLRAVRFATRFGFAIERSTAAAIRREAGAIRAISGERVREELEKMLSRPSAAEAAAALHGLGLMQAVLPELFAREGDWPAAASRLGSVGRRGDAMLALGALLAGLPAAAIRRIVRRWGGANSLRDGLVWMAEHLDDWRELPEAPPAALKRLLARPHYARLEGLWRHEERSATGHLRRWRAIRRRVRGIDPAQVRPGPLVTGEDLLAMGMTEGPEIGRVLRAVYEAQLNEEIRSRAEGLRLAQQLQHRGAEGQR